MKTPLLLTLALLVTPLLAHEGHEHADGEKNSATKKSPKPNPALRGMCLAAKDFLASLDTDEKKAAAFDFKNEERENWHYVPLEREGIRLDALPLEKQHLAHALLASGLSHKGYLTASQIMSLEAYLAEKSGNPQFRSPGKYYLAIFVQPEAKGTWAWRFEGHHLSINLTFVKGQIQDSPAFFGTNPAEIKDGPRRGLRPLGEIEDAARALATELQKTGHEVVFSKKSPREILTGQERKAKALAAKGVHNSDLKPAARAKILALFKLVYSYQRAELGAAELKKLRQQDEKKLTFAWAGSLERGQAHYFRLQSPNLLIEYANTQNGANHAHLSIRNFKGDFGRDLLKEHYQQDHEHAENPESTIPDPSPA